ncbi:MAG: type VI secretion system Vgr family protein [Novosphingobium sp.]
MAGRQTKLAINLGGEQVAIRRVEATEALGRPFSISVDVVAAHGEIDLLPHLGKAAAVTLSEEGELLRYFHGFLVEGEYISQQHDGYHYRLGLRPWTYFMSHTIDFRIFQEKNAIDIVKQIFAKYPNAKVDYGNIRRSRAPREYCVQYGESDFTFVTRLFEEEGIYYFYRHAADKHEMVLCEAPASHKPGKPDRIKYNQHSDSVRNVSSTAGGSAKSDYASRWSERVGSGGEAKVTMRDFNFTKADGPLQVSSSAGAAHPLDANEIYAFPGRYQEKSVGTPLSQSVLDAMRANRQVFSGESQSLGLSCGSTVKLSEHQQKRFNAEYMITRTHHVSSVEHERSAGSSGGSGVFIEAVKANVQWHVQPTVPRPSVKGPETAIITGPKGEEIFTDKYGRVKVRFHWDRSGSPDESSTCWIRVSQTGGLGNIILPRVGHEVIIDFLHGDPDRPIVTGRVFNSLHMPVYALPDNKTKALWRTKSYKSNTTSSLPGAEKLDVEDVRANELRFEDKNGQEEVFLHAERDMNLRVRYKESHHIGLDQEIKIGQDRSEYVKRHETVKIDGARKVDIKETDKLDVKKSITIDAGTEITMSAKAKITLKVGGSKIVIEPDGIKITGVATVDMKSPMTTVKGDGTLTLKGGMTFIN